MNHPDKVNVHDTAFYADGNWHVAKESATEASRATRRTAKRYSLVFLLTGAFVGGGVVVFVSETPTLWGVFFAALLGSATFFVGGVTSDVTSPPVRGAIPKVTLSGRAARRLTSEMRDRLITAANEGLLSRAIRIVEADAEAQENDEAESAAQRAEGIMHPEARYKTYD